RPGQRRQPRLPRQAGRYGPRILRELPRTRQRLFGYALAAGANFTGRRLGPAARALSARRGPGAPADVGRPARRALQPAVRTDRIGGGDAQLATVRGGANLPEVPQPIRGV